MIELAKISSIKGADIEFDPTLLEDEEQITDEQVAQKIKDREDILIKQINRVIQVPVQRNFERLDEELNKQQVLAIHASSFFPRDNTLRDFDDNQVFPLTDTIMLAPVDLPHLFSATELEYHIFSDDPVETITLSFQRLLDDGTLEQIGDAETSTISSSDQIISSTISGAHTISNDIGAYFIKAVFTSVNNTNLKIKKIIILHHR